MTTALLTHSKLRHNLPLTLLAMTLFLTGCGGGSNSAGAVDAPAPANLNQNSGTETTTGNTGNNSTVIAVTGKLLNVGYLGNTQVCADLDNDGQCGASEPADISDNAGNYNLSVPSGYRGVSLLTVVTPASIDSAATEAAPIPVQQGWTLPSVLEYPDDALSVSLNISPLTATYFARLRVNGRNRLSNQIALFTRIVYTTNLDPETGKLILPMDFDYVANPQNNLADRLKTLHEVLSERAQDAAAPLDVLTTTAVLASWYNTYTGPTAATATTTASPAIPVDARKIAAFADTNTNSVAYFLGQEYRYFKPGTRSALRLREGLTETAGWIRASGEGSIQTLDRRQTALANGAIVQGAARWENGDWTDLTVDEGGYYTLNPAGELTSVSGTGYQQPRSITFIDGNRLTFRMPGNQSRLAFEIMDSPGTAFFIEEWVGEQRSYDTYYNGTVPVTTPLTEKPACVLNYPGSPQPNTDVRLNSVAIADWYRVCFDYYTAEYYDQVKNDVALKLTDPALPGANFYDATLQEAIVRIPQRSSCGTDARPLATVTVQGIEHCNWAVDTDTNHTLDDLFSTGGVIINSWSKTYGTSTFTSGGVTTTATAGTEEQAGLPQQLILKLVRNGAATAGTGTLTSPYGAWTATSQTAVTETIAWEISGENPQMVLIHWPFRDVNDPRVSSGTQADGVTAAVSAPLLPGGHFTASWNGNNFSLVPSNHTAPNYRKLAILLQDGIFMTGEYYGVDYSYSERYFIVPAMTEGMAVMNYVFDKLYAAGFIDQEPIDPE